MTPENEIELDWEIDGVPCIIEVIGVIPGEPETGPYFRDGQLTDPGTPAVEPVIEYRVLDVTGEEADLLNEKIDGREHRQIIEAIEDAFNQEKNDGPY